MDSYKKDQENGKRKVVIAGGGLVRIVAFVQHSKLITKIKYLSK